MAIMHYDVDEMSSVFSVDAWMRLTWRDDKMVWNKSDFGDLKQIHFASHELWRPDIYLYNNAESTKMDPYGQSHFLVQSNGEVLWVPPATLKAFCKLKLTYWPMEKQECKLKFGSWTSHGDEIDLSLYKNMSKVS